MSLTGDLRTHHPYRSAHGVVSYEPVIEVERIGDSVHRWVLQAGCGGEENCGGVGGMQRYEVVGHVYHVAEALFGA